MKNLNLLAFFGEKSTEWQKKRPRNTRISENLINDFEFLLLYSFPLIVSFSEERMKLKTLVKKQNKAVKRATKLKEERTVRVREKSRLKIEKFIPRKQMIVQSEIK